MHNRIRSFHFYTAPSLSSIKTSKRFLTSPSKLLLIFSSIEAISEDGRARGSIFPREKILEREKYFQSVQKHTYLKGPLDKVTSVAIPIALAATSLFLIGKGIYNMSHGIGKKE